jgi:dehydrogenase/reductase SDR family member 12
VPRIRTALDDIAEASVVPSFTKVGYGLRRRLYAWPAPDSYPMRGRVVAVTGPTSGLGEVSATALASMGAHVLLLARNPAKAEATRERIAIATGNDDVATYIVDMSDLRSVREAVGSLLVDHPRIDVLINNAGSLLPSRERSVDGIEMTFATMVLGPFVLTNGLIPALRRSGDGRIITVTSGGMYTQSLHVDDLQMEREPYRGSVAYARAKRAQVVLTRVWASRLRGTSVVAHAMHPGWADTPGIEASLPRFRRFLGPLLRTPEQGADTLVWLSCSPEAARSTGELWLDRRPRPFDRLPGTKVSAEQALDLWEACERLSEVA